MPTRNFPWGRFVRRMLGASAVLTLVAAMCVNAHAQTNGTTSVLTTGINVVGGVSINAEGLVSNATTDALGMLRKLRLESLEKIPEGLNQTVGTRKVSLRRLEEAIAECVKNKQPLPDAVKYLAGLQRVQYVFVYPEEHDIVLVGPGEGWEVGPQGVIVGVKSRRPVLLLDDLLVALRTARAAAQGGITCSIDPTAEGLARCRTVMSASKHFNEAVIAQIENAMGLQNISVQGVPTTSHFARILVAADYRMKRLAMAFDPSPVRSLPNYLQMVSGSRAMQSPRFWLEPQYEALLRDADGLAWELRGSSVKAMTEEDYVTATGGLVHSGKANPAAQKWAKAMTREYSQLALADGVFGQLQNCMDLAVVGALVAKERLTEKANQKLPLLLDTTELKTAEFNAPQHVETKVSALHKGRSWVVSASGGVAINSWGIVAEAKTSDEVAAVRTKAIPANNANWWWN